MYLDHSYSLLPLSRAYRFEPVYAELKQESARHILGLEAPLWTEWVPNRDRLDYQTWPRLSAFAETGWTMPEHKNLRDFKERLRSLLTRMDEKGVRYAPQEDWEPPWPRRLFGLLSIARAKRQTA
jgi:hexosaminidase